MKMTDDLKELQEFTVEQFQENFDALIERVENGEAFIIRDGRKRVVIVPFEETIKFALDSLKPSVDEEVIRIHTDHEEGS